MSEPPGSWIGFACSHREGLRLLSGVAFQVLTCARPHVSVVASLPQAARRHGLNRVKREARPEAAEAVDVDRLLNFPLKLALPGTGTSGNLRLVNPYETRDPSSWRHVAVLRRSNSDSPYGLRTPHSTIILLL